MATLNISLPEQLRLWINEQVSAGRYSSASDYLRDLIRTDQRQQQEHWLWLQDHLRPLLKTPEDQFIHSTADDLKARMRRQLQDGKKHETDL